ncbi:MAG: zinc-dependent metalloprotease [Acidobacteriota bacterium]
MRRITVVSALLFVFWAPLSAQRAADTPSIRDKVAGMRQLEGFFNLYWEEKAEKMWLEIDKWNIEFLYAAQTPSNIEGRNRGNYGNSSVVRFERHGSKVLLTKSNYAYRANSSDPLEREAVNLAFTPPAIFGFRVAAEEGDRVLVDATDFFVRDAQGLGAGGVDRNRSAFYWPRTKNFPKNTEVELVITYNGAISSGAVVPGRPGAPAESTAAAGTGTTIRVHHSIVELPDHHYRTRQNDPRLAINGTSFLDFASPFRDPIRSQYLVRFRLIKKDPTAAISEPVKPIVYYIDSAAPEPIRSALVEGASWWNQAYEAAGFKNAFQAKVLPPDVDPMDLRYNVILWMDRPNRGWSSGGQVTDPRTGEIISGRVWLDAQRIRQDFLIGSSLKPLYGAKEPDTRDIEEMALARIRQLSAHEVGHTLGYGHNYGSSAWGRASVMDYPHPLIKIKEDGTLDFSEAYAVGIGEWDKVWVKYSHTQFPEGTDENEALDKIVNDSIAKGMYCLSDSGDGSMHPHVHDWDNGADSLAELERVLKIRQIALKNFSEKSIPPRTALARLEEVLVPAYLFHRYQTQAAGKSIGGINYRIAVRGDAQKPIEMVPADVQRKALDLVLNTVSEDVLALPEHILKLIPPRTGVTGGEVFPRRTAGSFDPLSAAETAAHLSMALVFNPARAARLINNRIVDENLPTLQEVIDTTLTRTWKTNPPVGPYKSEIHRVVNTVALYHLMALATSPLSSTQVSAIASLKIDQLKGWLKGRIGAISDESQSAHFQFAVAQIERYQADPTQFVIPVPQATPPGAPIGTIEYLLPGMVWEEDR